MHYSFFIAVGIILVFGCADNPQHKTYESGCSGDSSNSNSTSNSGGSGGDEKIQSCILNTSVLNSCSLL